MTDKKEVIGNGHLGRKDNVDKGHNSTLQHDVEMIIENYLSDQKYTLASVMNVRSILKELINKIEKDN